MKNLSQIDSTLWKKSLNEDLFAFLQPLKVDHFDWFHYPVIRIFLEEVIGAKLRRYPVLRPIWTTPSTSLVPSATSFVYETSISSIFVQKYCNMSKVKRYDKTILTIHEMKCLSANDDLHALPEHIKIVTSVLEIPYYNERGWVYGIVWNCQRNFPILSFVSAVHPEQDAKKRII